MLEKSSLLAWGSPGSRGVGSPNEASHQPGGSRASSDNGSQKGPAPATATAGDVGAVQADVPRSG